MKTMAAAFCLSLVVAAGGALAVRDAAPSHRMRPTGQTILAAVAAAENAASLAGGDPGCGRPDVAARLP